MDILQQLKEIEKIFYRKKCSSLRTEWHDQQELMYHWKD